MNFEKQQFISFILERAKEKSVLKEAKIELALFEKYDQIEYLFIIKELVSKLKEIGVSCIILRLAGASSIIAYLLGIHTIDPIKYKLSSRFFFEKEYVDNSVGPRFDICVPSNKKAEAIEALNMVSLINEKLTKKSIYYFGENNKYRLGIFAHPYLDRLNYALEQVASSQGPKWRKEYFIKTDEDFIEQEVLDYMFAPDGKGYDMPHLNGCSMGIPSELYEYMEIVGPKDLYDLAKIYCLIGSVFKNKKMVLESLRKNGIDGTIYSREQLLDILVNFYEIEENEAYQIIEHLLIKDSLTEVEIQILKSHEVSDGLLSQLNNIYYLDYMSFILQETYIAYLLAKAKRLGYGFEKLIVLPYRQSFVGPFFYINKKLYSYKEMMTSFNPNIRFFDSLMSHFDYFQTLGVIGDYGNYPRGRVLFDNYQKMFIVYMDKDLFSYEIKSLIIHAYNLEKKRTIFKRDSHYAHDEY